MSKVQSQIVFEDPKCACGKKKTFEAVMRLQYLCEIGMPLVVSTLFQKVGNWGSAFMCAFFSFIWKPFCISRHEPPPLALEQ